MLSIEKTLEWIDGQIMLGQMHLAAAPMHEAKDEHQLLLAVSIHARVTTLQQLRSEIDGTEFSPETKQADDAGDPWVSGDAGEGRKW